MIILNKLEAIEIILRTSNDTILYCLKLKILLISRNIQKKFFKGKQFLNKSKHFIVCVNNIKKIIVHGCRFNRGGLYYEVREAVPRP